MPKSYTERAWNHHFADYQARHNIPTNYVHYGPHCPTEDDLQIIGEVKGRHLIELGCGGGQCSIAFAKQGAKVTGVDFSEGQLHFARELAKKEAVGVRFLRADIVDLHEVPDGSQDIAFSAYAFQYVENLRVAFDEVYRILRSGGIFVFSLDHPFYWCLPEGIGELRIVRSYFNMRRIRGDLGYEYPRSFSELLNGLFDAGFIVARIVEPYHIERRRKEDRWPEYSLDRLRMVPATLILKVLKPHGFSELLRRRNVQGALHAG